MRVITIAFTTVMNNIPGYVEHPEGVEVTNADDLAEQAGRLCYLSWDRPNPKTADNLGYMANIIDKQHFSVVEHASATFYIDGVTRNFSHELIRHRHLSFSEVSQRYVDAGQFPFIRHPGLKHIDDDSSDALNESIIAGNKAYNMLVEDCVDQSMDRKQARQAARHALPGGTETKILVTGNLRAWREVLAKRLSPQADLEFQMVAQLLLTELKQMAPATFQDFEELPAIEV